MEVQTRCFFVYGNPLAVICAEAHTLLSPSQAFSLPSKTETFYIPKFLTSYESRKLEIQLSRLFEIEIDNQTTCQVNSSEFTPAHLWNDQMNSFLTNDSEHFLGSFMIFMSGLPSSTSIPNLTLGDF